MQQPRRPYVLLGKGNLGSYMTKAGMKLLALEKEFRAPAFPMIRNLLMNPLEELVSLDSPDTFVRAQVAAHGGILVLYDARCPRYQDDAVKWRKGKMSVKQILYDQGDDSYRLKNHKTDKGVSVMRRQTWIEDGNSDQGLRKHEYRLVNHEVFLKPESDGSLSRNEASSVQAFPLLLHYFRKDEGAGGGGGGGGSRAAVPRSRTRSAGRAKRKRVMDDDADDADDDEELDDMPDDDADDVDDADEARASDDDDAPRGRRKRKVPGVAPTRRGAPATPSGPAGLEIVAPHAAPATFAGGGVSLNDDGKRLRSADSLDGFFFDQTSILKDSLGADEWNDLPVFVEASNGMNILSPHTTCAVDSVVPDATHRPTAVLAIVQGFRSADHSDYEYSCTFADLVVPAVMVADGVLSFRSPAHQPGVVTFWISRRHRVTHLVHYTSSVPFYVLPAPLGDGRLSLAWNHLRTIPLDWIDRFADFTRELDVSFNMLSDINFCAGFPHLESLVCDNNQISAATPLPALPGVRQLSLNRNNIAQLAPFLQTLRASFPNLHHLSLLGNEACPIFTDDERYVAYRRAVIAHLPGLRLLDSSPVSAAERQLALRGQ